MKYNICFLDVDGVLNSNNMTKKYTRDGWFELPRINRQLDTECVERLDKLLQETNSKIVLSSTWRLDGGVKLKKYFKELNFKTEIIDVTGKCCSGIRGVEIYNWWNKNDEEYDNYFILDDDSDMLLWQQNHFFLVDREYGLSPTTCYKVKRFLGFDGK